MGSPGPKSDWQRMHHQPATSMKFKLMLIEDEKLFQELFTEIFAHDDLEITCVESGREALEQPLQDLYIVDLGLPGIDGIATLRALRAKFEHPVAAFMITGYDPQYDPAFLADHGVRRLLLKPFDIAELRQYIREFIRSQRPEGA